MTFAGDVSVESDTVCAGQARENLVQCVLSTVQYIEHSGLWVCEITLRTAGSELCVSFAGMFNANRCFNFLIFLQVGRVAYS